MKKNIRCNTFETNSSSSHSVTIITGNEDNIDIQDYLNIDYDSPDTFFISGGDFGWEVREYNDFRTKLEYAYSLTEYDESAWDMLEEVLRNKFPQIKEFNKGDYGYVDHQSADDMRRELFSCEKTLKTFLFSKGSVLYTDNDNRW